MIATLLLVLSLGASADCYVSFYDCRNRKMYVDFQKKCEKIAIGRESQCLFRVKMLILW